MWHYLALRRPEPGKPGRKSTTPLATPVPAPPAPAPLHDATRRVHGRQEPRHSAPEPHGHGHGSPLPPTYRHISSATARRMACALTKAHQDTAMRANTTTDRGIPSHFSALDKPHATTSRSPIRRLLSMRPRSPVERSLHHERLAAYLGKAMALHGAARAYPQYGVAHTSSMKPPIPPAEYALSPRPGRYGDRFARQEQFHSTLLRRALRNHESESLCRGYCRSKPIPRPVCR